MWGATIRGGLRGRVSGSSAADLPWLSGATEKLSHGEPAFFIGKRTFAMFASNHHGDGHVCGLDLGAAGTSGAIDSFAVADLILCPQYFKSTPYSINSMIKALGGANDNS